MAHGLCQAHYLRQRRGGDLSTPLRSRTTETVEAVDTKIGTWAADVVRGEAKRTRTTVYTVLKGVIEGWAKRKRAK